MCPPDPDDSRAPIDLTAAVLLLLIVVAAVGWMFGVIDGEKAGVVIALCFAMMAF